LRLHQRAGAPEAVFNKPVDRRGMGLHLDPFRPEIGGGKAEEVPDGRMQETGRRDSALLTVRFFSNRKEIFKPPFSRSAASRLGKSGLNLSLVAAGRAACDGISRPRYRACQRRAVILVCRQGYRSLRRGHVPHADRG